MKAPIRIGILGAAKIAPPAVIKPAKENPEFEVVAVGARDIGKAKTYAAEHGIPNVVGSYDELVRSSDVDLVYNALPPSGHAEWSIAALEAGKAVLCEKPFTRNAAEARKLVAAAEATGNVLIEAFHNRFHRVLRRAHEITASGELGKVKHAEAVFDVPIPYVDGELRWTRELGGGALMDLGTYCVHAIRTNLREEPRVNSARADVQHGVDASMEAEWSFASGATAKVHCSMVSKGFAARFAVTGERGSFEILNFLAPQMGCKFTVRVDGKTREEPTDGDATYVAQLKHVGDVLLRGAKQLTGGQDSIAQMEAIDATYEAAGMDRRF
ncbi:MAG TPA: Gfo/Idh/MocA family oxidoreductase [Rhizomicrobium sp.]|jgi:predicted dehydrogenase|nr:Gfo/Idh/MocA family oxidoreductase [Rhizomicrobium sp.]